MEDFRKILEEILENSGGNGIIFLSEADFQFYLAWQIKEKLKDKGEGKVILEYPDDIVEKDENGKEKAERIYYDIWVEDESGETHLIELKYPTAEINITRHEKSRLLKTHSAHDIGRYRFIADIARLESQNKIANGKSYCIMLTNDKAYYDKKRYRGNGTHDINFRIHNEKIIENHTLDWYFKDGEPKKRPSYMGKPLKVRHEYTCKWKTYCTVDGGGKNSEFKYLLLEIPPEKVDGHNHKEVNHG